jgi:uncharacterized membrane protein YqhA
MFNRIIGATRYLIIIAVVCILIAAAALLFYGAFDTYQILISIFNGIKSSKDLLLALIELVDLFLLSIILFVIAIGLYDLFVDDQVLMPAWLQIRNLDDLKEKLISVVIAVMSVVFLGQIIKWDGQRDLLAFGVANGVVIAALTYFLSQRKK